jgi:hypothetical protein
MFPDAEDTASHRAKRPIHVAGTLDVSLDFRHPIRVVVCRKSPVAEGAGMPEAAVEENGETALWEKEVRLTGEILNVKSPAGYPVSHQRGAESPFGRSITSRPDSPHPLAALRSG